MDAVSLIERKKNAYEGPDNKNCKRNRQRCLERKISFFKKNQKKYNRQREVKTDFLDGRCVWKVIEEYKYSD